MDEHLLKTTAMVAGSLLAGVLITKASSALSDVSITVSRILFSLINSASVNNSSYSKLVERTFD